MKPEMSQSNPSSNAFVHKEWSVQRRIKTGQVVTVYDYDTEAEALHRAGVIASLFVGEEIYVVKLAKTVVGSVQVEVKGV